MLSNFAHDVWNAIFEISPRKLRARGSLCWQLDSKISTLRQARILLSSTIILPCKLNLFQLVLTRLNPISQTPERDRSLIGPWRKKSLSEILMKILIGENRFGFSRHEIGSLHSPISLTWCKVELTTHLQSKNTNEIASTNSFILFLPALDYYDVQLLKIERHRSVYGGNADPMLSEYH